ncbi:MAG: carbamoyltransferase C-terminal domain-containing protein [Candidatus Falkowbacteria bacterium]
MKNSNIISIHYGHNASVALMQDGKITFAVSEERFNRIKNSTGFPELSLRYIKDKFTSEIDYYVMTQELPLGYQYLKKRGFKSSAYNTAYSKTEKDISLKNILKFKLFPGYFYKRAKEQLISSTENIDNNDKFEMEEYFSKFLEVEKNNIVHLDHHLCHAYSTPLFLEDPKEKTLVFTLDGEGDGLCATVNIFEKNEIKTISKINRIHSLGYLYREVTAFMGMKPDEHEFKVMGMAPYAKEKYAETLLPIFKNILDLNNKDEFECKKIPMQLIKYYLRDNLTYERFDNIAGAIQKFTEDITYEWVKRWVVKTGIKKIAVAGGVFMNVKMNQKIAEMPEVEQFSVTPSAGDESLVLGGCLYGYQKFCRNNNYNCKIEPVKTYYLGTEYGEREIKNFLDQNGYFIKHTISKPEKLNKLIAELLAKNEVVARFDGKMEFGARALGNRSILSNPASYENIRIINEMIKNRDFWMPFATSIAEEYADEYIYNPKRTNGRYMVITYDTAEKASKELIAALHPYDKTSRPQLVNKELSPAYHEIIEEFRKLTGIGGILNTSFNLHGEPNVEGPKDAMHTFEDSGLKYLVMGPYLIQKK